MKIAIASGKGGTGKTTISVNMATAATQGAQSVQYIDCDVEEPNGHIFLKPEIKACRDVSVAVPVVDNNKCTGCGKCTQLCQYNAIITIKNKAVVFEELCHSCGGCAAVCPTDAITEKQRKIGIVETGKSKNLYFAAGKLDIGAIQSPAVIRDTKKSLHNDAVSIIDAPPGTSCPVIEAVKGSDYVVLVTEPTPFGLNDLVLAADMVKELEIPFGVVINRSDIGDEAVENYCNQNDIEVLAQIPNVRKIAECYSKGLLIVEQLPKYKQQFEELFCKVAERFNL